MTTYRIYILYSSALDKYYVGSTNNVTERLKKNNAKHAGFTSRVNDWKLFIPKYFYNRKEALKGTSN